MATSEEIVADASWAESVRQRYGADTVDEALGKMFDGLCASAVINGKLDQSYWSLRMAARVIEDDAHEADLRRSAVKIAEERYGTSDPEKLRRMAEDA